MFNNLKSEEGLVFVFFVVTLSIVLYLVICNKNILDIAYLVVVIYYFIKFLIISRNYTN